MMNKNMLRQAQQLQQRLLKIQEELETTTVEATVGGGVVIATATGKQRITSIKIDPEAVVSDDVSMLEDLILAAVNEVMNKAAELANQKMSAVTGGMKIPGVM
ncbi:MAG: YbaB/EbfC family nucleoid-associated protein [Chloroflexota bacterium]|nr:YbaB/EbfC family nucleoid-associated protein [Chloroflexota bacterium]